MSNNSTRKGLIRDTAIDTIVLWSKLLFWSWFWLWMIATGCKRIKAATEEFVETTPWNLT